MRANQKRRIHQACPHGHTNRVSDLCRASHINHRLGIAVLADLLLLLLLRSFLLLVLCVRCTPHPAHQQEGQHSHGNDRAHHDACDSTSTQPIIPCVRRYLPVHTLMSLPPSIVYAKLRAHSVSFLVKDIANTPVSAFQIWMRPPLCPEATRVPSGEYATAKQYPSHHSSVPLLKLTTATPAINRGTTTLSPSGENATPYAPFGV